MTQSQSIQSIAAEKQFDTMIVGAGSAGLVSALALAEAGKRVIVLEKMAKPGGNSIRASSGMNAAKTVVQEHAGIKDTYESFFEDTYRGGGRKNDVDMLRYFTSHAAEAVDWLKEHGIVLDDLTLTGGMSVKRAHRPSSAPAIGGYLIHHLVDDLTQKQVPILCQTKVVNIMRMESGDFQLIAENQAGDRQTLRSATVILATGGFSASQDLIAYYRPDLLHYRTTNQPGATGDGLRLAQQLGAQLIDMEEVQVHPTVYQDSARTFLIGETVRGEGAILVNHQGSRFVNELATRKEVTAAINAQSPANAFLIFNQSLINRVVAVQFYDQIGLVTHGANLAELADQLKIPQAALDTTMATWQTVVHQQHDAEFGRTTGLVDDFATGPFAAIPVAPAVHYTMGGVKVNVETQVLDDQQQPIAGLYAAGETVGGLHGNNRLGGNSIAETVVFGLAAARQIENYQA
ncbi:flavocytochrome c [Pediococcus acidilactici]|uniref:flavocytochrome c n=1 Tax=Pediococcus acidilactici TaxID=1254 RepID=UPI003A93197A